MPIPPAPIGEPANSFAWQQWYLELQRSLSVSGQIAWTTVSKTGANLTDIPTRDHASLQNMQREQTGERYHLTSAQQSVIASGIDAGTWTPTLTNVTNLDSSTAYASNYLRLGNTVVCSGKVDVDATAAAATELGISLPIASNFATEQQCAGTAVNQASTEQGAILADTTNDRASLKWTAAGTGSVTLVFTFIFRVV